MVSLQALVQSIPKPRRGIPEVIWIQASRDLAQGRFWPSLFTTIGCLSNIAYTCTLPFVTVGIIAGIAHHAHGQVHQQDGRCDGEQGNGLQGEVEQHRQKQQKEGAALAPFPD